MGREGRSENRYRLTFDPPRQVPEGSRMSTKGYEWLRELKLEKNKWQVSWSSQSVHLTVCHGG
jgi:hypothetical protein